MLGGTGLYQMEGLSDVKEVWLDTPFGKPSDLITVGELDGVGIAFVPRHGRGHAGSWLGGRSPSWCCGRATW